MTTSEYRIEFPEGYFGQLEEDTPARGCLDVQVQLVDGTRYPLAFYDPIRLQQTLDHYVEKGAVHFSEPGLVLLTSVTTENVRRAVEDLFRDGYFSSLRPL